MGKFHFIKGALKDCQCGCKGWLKLHLLINSQRMDMEREQQLEDEEFVYDEDNLGNEDDAVAQCCDDDDNDDEPEEA